MAFVIKKMIKSLAQGAFQAAKGKICYHAQQN